MIYCLHQLLHIRLKYELNFKAEEFYGNKNKFDHMQFDNLRHNKIFERILNRLKEELGITSSDIKAKIIGLGNYNVKFFDRNGESVERYKPRFVLKPIDTIIISGPVNASPSVLIRLNT